MSRPKPTLPLLPTRSLGWRVLPSTTLALVLAVPAQSEASPDLCPDPANQPLISSVPGEWLAQYGPTGGPIPVYALTAAPFYIGGGCDVASDCLCNLDLGEFGAAESCSTGEDKNHELAISAIKDVIQVYNESATGAPLLYYAGETEGITVDADEVPVGITVASMGSGSVGAGTSTYGSGTLGTFRSLIRFKWNHCAEDPDWTTDPSATSCTFRNTLTHEFGHALGLQHPNEFPCNNQSLKASVMDVTQISGGAGNRRHRRRLRAYDILALRQAYNYAGGTVNFAYTTTPGVPLDPGSWATASLQTQSFVPPSVSHVPAFAHSGQAISVTNESDEVQFLYNNGSSLTDFAGPFAVMTDGGRTPAVSYDPIGIATTYTAGVGYTVLTAFYDDEQLGEESGDAYLVDVDWVISDREGNYIADDSAFVQFGLRAKSQIGVGVSSLQSKYVLTYLNDGYRPRVRLVDTDGSGTSVDWAIAADGPKFINIGTPSCYSFKVPPRYTPIDRCQIPVQEITTLGSCLGWIQGRITSTGWHFENYAPSENCTDFAEHGTQLSALPVGGTYDELLGTHRPTGGSQSELYGLGLETGQSNFPYPYDFGQAPNTNGWPLAFGSQSLAFGDDVYRIVWGER